MMFNILISALFFLSLIIGTSLANRLNFDDNTGVVNSIMDRVSELLYQKHNISLPEIGMAKSEEGGNLVENDMLLTVDQAYMILDNLQNEMGVQVNIGAREEEEEEEPVDKRVSVTAKKWTFPVKYAFDGTHNDAEKEVIRRGINFWQTTTCVTLQEVTPASQIASTSSLTFTKGSGCSSYVGIVSPSTQPVSLATDCVYEGIVAHEVGHALGLYHEHMRSDRDDKININLANAITGYAYAFAKIPAKEDNNYGIPYDFESIMHYGSLGFSNNYYGKKRVIEPLDSKMLTSLGNRKFLSFNDAKRINIHYNCIATACAGTALSQPCQNGGYQDPKNCVKCRCPPGWGGDFCTTNAQSRGVTNDCGGRVNVAACSTAVITSPSYPSSYPLKSACSWLVQAPPGSGLVFGFETKPNLPCDNGDTCNDFVEIRTNNTDPTMNGAKFCKCGQNSGRLYSIDSNKATVIFASYEATSRGSSGSRGFRLNVYATCPGTTGSTLTKECVISSTGYDYDGKRSQSDSGQTCSLWSGSSYEALSFPDETLLAAGRSCRNPDSRASPWCYVDSGYKSTAYCNTIPKCPTGTNSEPLPPPIVETTTISQPIKTTTAVVVVVTTKQPKPVIPGSVDCRNSVAGREYIGKVSVTRSGLPCQRWDNQWPQAHSFTNGRAFPDGQLWLANNYCRNPDPTFNDGVWCFTTSPAVRMELCNVPLCNQDVPVTAKKRSFSNYWTWLLGKPKLDRIGREAEKE